MNITRKSINQWCVENQMTLVGLSNIAYVPYGTLKHLLNEEPKPPLMAKIHVYNLTGLTSIKPSKLDIQEYERICKDHQKDFYWERKISEKFIADWKESGLFPETRYTLTNRVDDSKPKKELTTLLKKVLFNEGQASVQQSIPAKTSGSISKLREFHKYANQIYALGDSEFTKYIKNNLHDIRAIAGLFNIMLDPDPVSARKTMNDSQTMLNPFKIKS